MRLLAALVPHLAELAGQVVGLVGDAERQRQVAVFEGHAFDRHADAEVAEFLVAVGLERRFAEDLPQHVAG